MDEQEKREFLKSMGYKEGTLDADLNKKKASRKQSGRPNLYVDKSELLNLYRIFHDDTNTAPKPEDEKSNPS